jgi:predicted acylesterase/phospholipase RssA
MDTSPSLPLAEDPPGWKSREVRLGVIMYGGVSLAIYIFGVTQELFQAVRGRGVYKLLKTLTDSDIVVDVISGTSAGGINGIILAYALCNERDISPASALWREDGDIRRLLRSPRDSIGKSTSLLDSAEYYQSRLEKSLPGENGILFTRNRRGSVRVL